MNPSWQHRVVHDLAWLIGSPPLLRPSAGLSRCDAGLCAGWLHDSLDWLSAMDREPAALIEACARQKDHRLGHQVEALLATWLSWPENPHVQLVARNVVVRDGKRTVGELDFLVRDRRSGELQHWELAVKFYLGRGQGRQGSDWVGPGLQDSLSRKLERLRQHQLRLLQTTPGRLALADLGIDEPVRSLALVKGRLFHPWSRTLALPAEVALDHPQGWWLDAERLPDTPGLRDLRWLPLPGTHWLTPLQAGDRLVGSAMDHETLLTRLAEGLSSGRAQAVIGVDARGEVTRGFLTPGWQAQPPRA